MWCKSCRQDVPGIASLDEGAFHCARCGARVGRRKSSLADAALANDICDQGINLESDIDLPPSPTEALHQWAEDEHLENVRRLLRPLSTGESPKGMPSEGEPRFRFDPPASNSLRVPLPAAALHAMASTGSNASAPKFQMQPTRVVATPIAPSTPTSSAVLLTAFAWCVVSLGSMAMVCGGVLTAWSLFTGRAELWKFGLPTVVCGLAVLVIGALLTSLAKRAPQNHVHPGANLAALPVGYAIPSYATPGAANTSPAVIAELRGQLDRLSAQMSTNQSPSQQGW